MAERTMPVTVQVPARTWWILANAAEVRGITVAELLVQRATGEAGRGAGQGKGGKAPGRNRATVARLHARGLTDVQIADALGCTRNNVIYHRRVLGLGPNADQDHAA